MEISRTGMAFTSPSMGPAAQDEFMRIASSGGLTPEQRTQACRNMLQELQEILDGLEQMFADAEWRDISPEQLMQMPNMQAYARSRVDEAMIKIEALRARCSDVLPPREMRRIDELERQLGEIQKEIEGEGEGTNFQVDWAAVGRGLSDAVSIGLGIVGGVLWWLTGGPLRSPGY